MKKFLFFTMAVLTFSFAQEAKAQTPDWLWAKSAGGASLEQGRNIVTDANGNVFVTGYFGSSLITFGSTTLTNAGSLDIFIVKYNNLGNVLWAKSVGGTGEDVANGIVVDGNGNIYITGYFTSSSITLGTTTLTNVVSNIEDFFVAKYDTNGNVIWAKSAGGTSYDVGKSITTDSSGNVYISGDFGSSSLTLGTTTLTCADVAGHVDVFLVKYDNNGNVIWAKREGGLFADWITDIVIDDNNNLYVTGYFQSSSISFGSTILTNAGTSLGTSHDVFVVKYDNLGNVLWAKGAGGTNFDYGMSIATDVGGNVYVTGGFASSSIAFGSTTLNNLGSVGNTDLFVVKYNNLGNVLWAKSTGGTGGEMSLDNAIDDNGNVYLVGAFSTSSISFDSTTLTNTSSLGAGDIFVVKYNNNGNALWAKNAGGTGNDGGNSIAIDGSGNVYLTGSFGIPSITFGSTTLTNADTVFTDMFVAKLHEDVTGIIEENFSNAIDIYPNPFSSQTILQSNILLHNANLSIENIIGQKVKEIKNISGQKLILNRDNMLSGLYLLRLSEGNKTIATKKLVISD